ncbi:MAG: hypothetical protein QOF73_1001, partial [Thermomicrobiales bacterium]|nr:hypothetical protein [Thermomicrobiales bacterium]
MKHRRRAGNTWVSLATVLFVASLLAVPMSQAGARQQDDAVDSMSETGVPAQMLIAQELHDGKIDYETSLVYRAYALFDDPRLPADLAGTGSFGEDNAFFGQ